MTTILLVSAGGFIGANVRFAIASWSRRRYGTQFPVGTLIANVSGSFLIGIVLGLLAEFVTDDRDLRLLIAVGFLGAETTFSTFAMETVALLDQGERNRALANVATNTVASLAAAATGLVLAWLLAATA